MARAPSVSVFQGPGRAGRREIASPFNPPSQNGFLKKALRFPRFGSLTGVRAGGVIQKHGPWVTLAGLGGGLGSPDIVGFGPVCILALWGETRYGIPSFGETRGQHAPNSRGPFSTMCSSCPAIQGHRQGVSWSRA
ncbi:MAG: hypothetical protein CM15mP103_10530 [Gammaproteobacteria bacterium]|nr:MAG: hypothetical protein CM15mP103_10530 [Gammaproteobacteria bacterium]